MAHYKLRWNFDVSTFKLLGRELITDKITALFELVKNCYDANADRVTVTFNNVTNLNLSSQIVIKDDGLGMSLYDIRYKWMVIGTNSKREKKVSPAPYFRKVVGEKGVGRFAVEKLGSKILIQTTQKGTTRKVHLELDWTEYEKITQELEKKSTNKKTKLFTDIENNCWVEPCSINEHGTSVTIFLRNTDQIWTYVDISQADKELSKLISPIKLTQFPFDIFLMSNEYENYHNKHIESKSIEYATEKLVLDFDTVKETQETLVFANGMLIKKLIPIPIFGPVYFELYYFNQEAKRIFKTNYKGGDIDGIKIYRDGVIATPFAESENKDDKKRDILGINKRRYSGFFDKVSSQDLLGFLEITNEKNPRIKDATNRQDFLDYPEYRALKQFIINQIEALESYLTFLKEQTRTAIKTQLVSAETDISDIENQLNEISVRATPEVRNELKLIIKGVRTLRGSISKGVRQYSSLQKEIVRKENIFMSLMSLQDYATELAHVVRTSLGKILHLAEFFNTDFPNPLYDDLFAMYAHSIYDEMQNLDKAVDFMLSYARSESDFETFDVATLLNDLFKIAYRHIFEKEHITAIVEIKKTFLITHNKKFFEDIFENLITNSVKALVKVDEKIIKCTGTVDNEKFVIYFSDNGCGIPEDDKDKVFDIYHTTTQNSGGAGIGLFTVKKRMEALKGNISIEDPEFKPHGTTFKIELPFNK